MDSTKVALAISVYSPVYTMPLTRLVSQVMKKRDQSKTTCEDVTCQKLTTLVRNSQLNWFEIADKLVNSHGHNNVPILPHGVDNNGGKPGQ